MIGKNKSVQMSDPPWVSSQSDIALAAQISPLFAESVYNGDGTYRHASRELDVSCPRQHEATESD